ncbi:MAG: sulfurtransferase TusA family protein [Actinomycetota bacterium]
MKLDCRGMRCPIPIIKLANALKSHPEVVLLSDDPATLPDLTAWSRMTRNSFQILDANTYLVKKN